MKKITFIFMFFVGFLSFAQPTTYMDIGNIGTAGSYTFDSFNSFTTSTSSNTDTEMGLWDAAGALILANDDDGSGGYCCWSLITTALPDGDYYIGISEFNSVFAAGFLNNGSGFEPGDLADLVLNIDGTQVGVHVGASDALDQETAFFKINIGPPPAPSAFFTFCSVDTPLPIDPPTVFSTPAAATDTGSPADTGLIGAGLGEYTITSVDLNIQSNWASDLTITLQSPAGTSLVLTDGNGGIGGLSTAADLVFTDTSANDVTLWGGGAPMADYLPEGGLFAATFAGEDINGDWYLLVEDAGFSDGGSLNSYCITFERSVGTPPEIFCPADFATDNDAGVCGAEVTFFPLIAIDAEDGVLAAANVVQTAGIPSGGFFPVGDNDVTFTATDSHLNETSCTFVITILDTEDPVAVCQPFTVTLDATGNGSLVATDLDGGSTDNCAVDSFIVSQDTFSCADVGDVTVTLTVFDVAGNSHSCDATVTVVDDIAPVVTCIGAPGSTVYSEDFEAATIPIDWTMSNAAGVHDWTFGSGTMPFSDPFPTNAAIFDDDAAGGGQINNASLLSPMYDMTGAIGGTLSYDYSLDELGAGETLTVEVWDGTAWQQVALYDVDALPVNSGDIDVLAHANAAFQVKFTYDDAGAWGWGAGVDNFLLTVETPPAPPLEVVLDADGMASLPAASLITAVNEACGYTVTVAGGSGGATTTLSSPLIGGNGNFGNMFDIAATNEVTISSFDIHADTGAVLDVEVYAKTGTHVGSENTAGDWTLIGTASGVVSNGDGVVTPLGLDLMYTIPAGDTHAFFVSPVDTTTGGFNYHNGTAVGDTAASDANITLLEGSATSNDFAGTIFAPRVFEGSVIYTSGSGGTGGAMLDLDCSNLGENIVEVFVTDNAGNTGSCFATINVVDNTAPVLVCGPGATVFTDDQDFESSTIPSGWSTDITAGSQDWEFGSGDLPTGDDFTTLAAIFNDDAAGSGNTNAGSLLSPIYDLTGVNSASVSYEVAFQEAGDQEFYVEVWDGAAWQQIALYDEDLTPNIQSVTLDILAYVNADFQVRFRYDDFGGWGWHAAIDNFQVMSSTAPVTTDVIVELGADGTATLDPMDFVSEATDACGIDVITATLEDVSCADIGAPIAVTVFASDASGNISSCIANVVVVDLLAPVLVCPPNADIELDIDGTHTLADYIASGEATATDNCTDPLTIFTQDPAAGTVLGYGVHIITFTAEDEYGNVATCTFDLNLTRLGVEDNELSNAISMYPNPANEQVILSNSSNILLETAMIYDINGKLISQINLQDMQTEKVINVSSFATGVYMVHITSDKASVVKRLIKR